MSLMTVDRRHQPNHIVLTSTATQVTKVRARAWNSQNVVRFTQFGSIH